MSFVMDTWWIGSCGADFFRNSDKKKVLVSKTAIR